MPPELLNKRQAWLLLVLPDEEAGVARRETLSALIRACDSGRIKPAAAAVCLLSSEKQEFWKELLFKSSKELQVGRFFTNKQESYS
jgi:hypothetical protein